MEPQSKQRSRLTPGHMNGMTGHVAKRGLVALFLLLRLSFFEQHVYLVEISCNLQEAVGSYQSPRVSASAALTVLE